ncbi:MAG: hypothetical protein ACJ8FY_02015 [Gemmataceae bacterium]
MEEALRQAWDNLFDRVDGPMSFRLIVQPVIATFLAIRAGWKDAREGRSMSFWTLARNPSQTRAMLRNMWIIAGKVFLVALVLDAVYQIIVLHWIYPVQALIVATLLALVPCIVVRAVGNRIAAIAYRRQPTAKIEVPRLDSKDAGSPPEIIQHHDIQITLREEK